MNEVANSTVTMVGNIGEIPVGEGRAFDVNGEQVAVFRLRDGSLRALGAACPHKGGPLADGLVDASVVICPLHGYTYDLTTGEETAFAGAAVGAYHATTDASGNINISAGEGP